MNLAALKTELDGDPLTRGYAGMNDAAAATDLNTVYRTRNRASISGNDMFSATDGANFSALTDAKRALWVSFCNTDRDPFDVNNVAFVTYIFGGGSTTMTNLAAIRTESVSRADELGLGVVRAGEVQQARAL